MSAQPAHGDWSDRPARLAEALDVTIDPGLLERALTHRSYAYENGGLPDQRAAGVPRRLGARAGRHRHALPQPPRAARGPAGEAAGRGRQHACARRRRPRPRHRRRTSGSAAARRRPAAGTSPRSSPTPSRRVLGAVYIDQGLEAAARAGAPAVRPADRPGRDARRRPRLEDQPAGAHRDRRARRTGVRRLRDRPGPREGVHRGRPGRRRGRTARAAAAARRRPSRRPPRPPGGTSAPSVPEESGREPGPPGRRPDLGPHLVCPSCPRSRSSAAGSSPLGRRPHRRRRRRRTTRAPYAGTSPAAPTSPPGSPDAPSPAPAAAASTSGCRCDGHHDAVLAHLGMSGQLLVQAPGRPDETHLRVRLDVRRRRPGAAVRRPAHLRRARPSSTWSTACRCRSRTSPATRSTRQFDDAAWVAALRRRRTGLKRALLDQTLVSGIGNIYADEALWRARLHWARATDTLPRPKALRGPRRRPGGDGRGALAAGRHVVRLAVRQRQRRERLLRPVAARLRPHRRAVRPLRRVWSSASRS